MRNISHFIIAAFISVAGVVAISTASVAAQSTEDCKEDFNVEQSIYRYNRCADPPREVCPPGSATALVGSTNAEKAYNFFVDNGLQPFQAAGIVGNLMVESTPEISPTIVNPESGAYGIAQWMGARQTKLKALSGYDTFDVQLQYLWDELNGPYSYVLNALKATTNVADATFVILTKYEIPCVVGSSGRGCDSEQAKRLPFAEGALSTYGNGAGTGTSTAGSGCIAPGGDWSSGPAGSYSDSSIPCPAGTTDAGTVRTTYSGPLVETPYPTIRLCTLSSIAGSPRLNAAVAGQFQSMGEAAKAAGRALTANSSFRPYDSCGGSGAYGCAPPGLSNHQLGIAIDFALTDGRKSSLRGCENRSTSKDPRWIWMRDNAINWGIRQLDYENWHWDTEDNRNRC